MQFYQCPKCGKIVTVVQASKCQRLVCCGEEMQIMQANSTDAAGEKHVPVIVQNGNLVKVSVGSVTHPMMEEHFIQWIILETEQGHQKKELKPGQDPQATFAIADGDKLVAVYEYCNLHGLWKA